MEFTVAGQYYFKTTECCGCGVIFAMTADLYNNLKETHKSFYCPNGHSQHFTGKSEAQVLKEKLQQKEQELSNMKCEKELLERKLKNRRTRRKV